MHQPYYVDTARGAALMPWVRLHATKGYLDMVWLAEQFPALRCTFNLTPVLLKQIRELAGGEVGDLWHELAATPAEALTSIQKCNLLEHFFKANWEHMLKPYPRYRALLQKRGVGRVRLDRAAASFSEQDCRDLQVWFNLAWFGYAAERLYPDIAELKRKDHNFTEQDKQTVLEHQRDALQRVLGFYKTLADAGQIELSTTPFYHPILPLVYNTEFARRCMPGRKLPAAFSHPEDVRAQLTLARDFHAQVFGKPPRGVWPSEGSVCPELIPVLHELGFEWFATDEEVLWRSLAVVNPGKPHDRMQLFQGYRAQFGDAAAALIFRDRGLSDFIGFAAARNDPTRAADFIVSQLENIARHAQGDNPLCAVVLDGENAWEHFADGGEAFLRQLYQRLTTHAVIRTTTPHEYLTTHPPSANLSTLHTGSWINADFDIWIGHHEENRAWELLGQTRNFLQAKADRHEISPEQFQAAMQEIYAAEGSDWFWWYGDDFVTENDILFDELFRTHLQNAYRIAGAPVPESLKLHICRSEAEPETTKPSALITPQIDGQVTSYYEWAGAGVYHAGRTMSTMYRGERLIEAIYFGFDLQNLYLRVDFRPDAKLPADAGLRIQFVEPSNLTLSITDLRQPRPVALLFETNEQGASRNIPVPVTVAAGRILELGLPFSALNWTPGLAVSFYAQLLDNGVERQHAPEPGLLRLRVPEATFETENWYV
jgi:alpha-amylase/alpha-mannosidase (GH57 family)